MQRPKDMSAEVKVVGLTRAGVQCRLATDTGLPPFWLSKRACTWSANPDDLNTKTTSVLIPAWLAAKHRQLVGDELFKQAKERKATMAHQQRDESGILFKADNRQSDKHPTHKGEARVAGRDYWLSAWLKTGRSGTKFLSLSFKDKEEMG